MNAELGETREYASSPVLDGRGKPCEIGASVTRVPRLGGKTIALTTGQAARYCLVSPDTMAKWIKDQNLPAQRTIGGKYRILVDDLRRFMIHHDMSTTLLDAELDSHPYCWECHALGTTEAYAPGNVCYECPVHRAKALNCYELRMISAKRNWACADCEKCAYFMKWANQRSEE